MKMNITTAEITWGRANKIFTILSQLEAVPANATIRTVIRLNLRYLAPIVEAFSKAESALIEEWDGVIIQEDDGDTSITFPSKGGQNDSQHRRRGFIEARAELDATEDTVKVASIPYEVTADLVVPGTLLPEEIFVLDVQEEADTESETPEETLAHR